MKNKTQYYSAYGFAYAIQQDLHLDTCINRTNEGYLLDLSLFYFGSTDQKEYNDQTAFIESLKKRTQESLPEGFRVALNYDTSGFSYFLKNRENNTCRIYLHILDIDVFSPQLLKQVLDILTPIDNSLRQELSMCSEFLT